MLDKLAISDEQLQDFLRASYGLTVARLEFLPLGNDSNTWIYRVTDATGTDYCMKARPVPFYEASCSVPAFLRLQGINAVVAPLPNLQNSLWTVAGDFAFILYPFITGETSWRGMSVEQWRTTGAALKAVHSCQIPPNLTDGIRQETFAPPEIEWIADFDRRLDSIVVTTEAEASVLATWKANRPAIQSINIQLAKLAEQLRPQAGSYVICHADLHPANIMRQPGSSAVHIIDWDEVKLAPKERDFLFVPQGTSDPLDSPFFAGYDRAEIDWTALTYYRCERVAQDVVAYTQEVFERPDLSAASKAMSADGLTDIFTKGGEVELAFETAKRLPNALQF